LIEEDEHGAFLLYRETASCGHVGAMFMVGDCYLDGIGTKKDLGLACEWLFKAGEQGHRCLFLVEN
jgi:TPR repeat protein